MSDFDPTTRIAFCAIVWLAVLMAALRTMSKPGYPTTGLTFTFIGCYTSFHIGALVYLTDGYDPSLDPYLASFGHTPVTVALGTEASTLAMLFALLGAKAADELAGGANIGPIQSQPPLAALKNGAVMLISAGLFGLILENFFSAIISALPGLQAVISSARNLFVIGGCLLAWSELRAGRKRNAAIISIFFTLALPLVVLAKTAILADSIFLALASFSFFLAMRSAGRETSFVPNIGLIAGLMVGGFVFSALHLEYRDEIREVIARGGNFTEAITTISKSGRGDIELQSSAGMQKTFYAIDSRLNQNLFIGMAIQKLEALPDTYEDGATIALALFGWVPRFLWPGKPERGGATMITKHTGKRTDGSTSFGAGLIFEFFVNFGYVGVVAGFLVVGFLVRLIDAAAYRSLLSGQITSFSMYELMGFALLQPGTDLFFIVTSLGTAVVFSAAMSQPIAYVTAPARNTARPPAVNRFGSGRNDGSR